MNDVPMQPTAVEYRVCSANSVAALTEAVNEGLRAGFTLHGPLAVTDSGYLQPLVRVELRPIRLPGQDSTIMPVSGILKR